MLTQTEQKIHFYSRLMRLAAVLLFGILIFATGYFIFVAVFEPNLLGVLVRDHLVGASTPFQLSTAAILTIALVIAVNLAFILGGLLSIWRLGNCLDMGLVFVPDVGVHLRMTGFYTFACAISQFLSHTILILVLSYSNGAGPRQLSFAFSSDMGFLLLVACLLMVLGHVMVLAAEINEENREFI
jgi:hypothetical protein